MYDGRVIMEQYLHENCDVQKDKEGQKDAEVVHGEECNLGKLFDQVKLISRNNDAKEFQEFMLTQGEAFNKRVFICS